jgi:hypothetical protein
MVTFLTVLSGLSWTVVYLAGIKIGFRDKADAIPFIALSLNIVWEGLYSYVFLSRDITNIQGWINLVWFVFDIFLVIAYARFARGEFAKIAPVKYFVPWTVFVSTMAVVLQVAFWKGFPIVDYGTSNIYQHLYLGSAYSAFLQNLVMSFLFIIMFLRRRGGNGQHMVIAVAKFIGTLAPTIIYTFYFHNWVIAALGLFTAVLDVAYIWMLSRGEKFFQGMDDEQPSAGIAEGQPHIVGAATPTASVRA